MKAVIVEIRGNYVAALSDDGCVTEHKNQNYVIGQVIEMKETANRRFGLKAVLRTASVAAVIALFSLSAWAYYTPYTYVSLDVNPSIEYSLNRFERVLGVKAANGDGEEIVQNLRVKNKGIEQAIQETLKEIKAKGYLNMDDPGGIVIAASCKNIKDAEKLAEALKNSAEETIEEEGVEAEVESLGIGAERVLEAQKLGVTPGKLNLVQKLQASFDNPESIKVDEWLDKPVKEIMKTIKDNRKEDSNADKPGKGNSPDKVKEEDSEDGEDADDDADDDDTGLNNGNKNKEKESNKNTETEENENGEDGDTDNGKTKENGNNKSENNAGGNGNAGSNGNSGKGKK